MKLRQAKKIRAILMRRTLERYGWEGCDRPLPAWDTTRRAAYRLKRISKLAYIDTLMTWQHEANLVKTLDPDWKERELP